MGKVVRRYIEYEDMQALWKRSERAGTESVREEMTLVAGQ